MYPPQLVACTTATCALLAPPALPFAAAQAKIPATGEVRSGDRVHVVGAAGPMGSMATIRLVSSGISGIAVEASDMAVDRLEVLKRKAVKVAEAKGVECHLYNPKDEQANAAPDYVMMMVPVGPLVAASVKQANANGIINIFAGIPADVHQDIDLNAFVEKRPVLYRYLRFDHGRHGSGLGQGQRWRPGYQPIRWRRVRHVRCH